MTKPGANVEAVAHLWGKGLTAPLIASRLGLSESTVRGIARQNRDRCPVRRPLAPSDPARPTPSD